MSVEREDIFSLIEIDKGVWQLTLLLKSTSVILATGSKWLCLDVKSENEEYLYTYFKELID